ncbi:hypothetical protein Ahy_B04g073518 [Arachis hypogaea]|uniref:Uncharacterized protein n=1 Tax=Arachis hypogaea TaxID=3818 RepID=A0A444ZQR3_ARAHY|nr:hypothetical protein Ahy_B04g073518 [Arachis hypogaea]
MIAETTGTTENPPEASDKNFRSIPLFIMDEKAYGQSILEELRRQSEDINLSSEDELEQISLNDDGDQISKTEILNQSGVDLPEPAAPKNKRDENEPLLVKVKDTSTGEIMTRKMTAIQVCALKKMDKVEENFEFDYATGVKWVLRTLGDRWKAHKYNLRGEYFFPNKRKIEILAANPSNIPPIEWIAFVDHYMDHKTKKQCLQNARNREKLIVLHAGESKSNARRATQMEKKLERPVYRSEVIVSTLLKKDESYVSGEGQRLVEKIAKHLPEDQERAATEGIHSKVLAHPDVAIGKVCGPENGKRVCGFSNAACPSGFGKSKRIFGGAICGDLERQLQEAKNQVATLYKFLQQKYDDEVHTFSNSVLHIQSN